ncbi:glycerophosphoryl diester phosphodiesterase [Paenibacillus baekrokdamisoli]|uniref:Glycerophosphoryl diester phosphodiesterase n=1 Tax=Paenibacillus baekrokdamisoli TaxID=1712516 RepID=A0A3G9JEJ9_9BACL|nr:glycerophosphodiester phosphodiesterase family protein [Paenibacillus baekrokdamisoli]MBB3070388.1 glycerophosphoryl diester phosphodiesterase [Paenibacillus baekrokdamisoli]BBH21389.1 glycerophosphoryl diester phosphodiesterase [Paenibacillus baekrokdamisoli]
MSRRFPLITAHSGSMNTIAHTLHSVQTGLELGADIVEEDVRVTKDGIPVLAHDDEWVTVDGRKLYISQMTYEELRELQFECNHGEHHETVRIYRLEEMLPIIQTSGKVVNLDLKVDESIEPVAALVRSYGLSEQVFLSGCEKDRAMMAQQLNPEMRKLLNTDTLLFRTLSYRDAMVQTCEDAHAASCFGINIYHSIVQQEFMDYATSQGLPVYVWTVNEEELMRHYTELGVASITTRNVSALVQLNQKMLGE